MNKKSLTYRLFIALYFMVPSITNAGCLDVPFLKVFSEIRHKISVLKEKRKNSKVYPILEDLIQEQKEETFYTEVFSFKDSECEIKRIQSSQVHDLLKEFHKKNYNAFYLEKFIKINSKYPCKEYSENDLLPKLYTGLVHETGEPEEESYNSGLGFRFMFILTITKSNAEYKENFLYEITNIDFPKLTVKISRIPKKNEISKSPLSSFKNPLEDPAISKRLFMVSFVFANHLIQKLDKDQYLPDPFFKRYSYIYTDAYFNEDCLVRITEFGYTKENGYFQNVADEFLEFL